LVIKKNYLKFLIESQNILPYKQMRKNSFNYYYKLAPYLTGLIEGDGYIFVHDKNTKAKKYHPKIIIVFNLTDKPLAKKLFIELKVGKVISKPNVGHIILQILAKDKVLKIINLINGCMRIPKIEALHRARS
jgi:LAGLIDADG endonuclease